MRKYTTSVRCAEPGCNAYGHFGFDTKRDQCESKVSSKPYWCSRHTNREGILGMNNLAFTATKTYEAIPSKIQGLKGQLFWNNSNGFACGDGWKAWAKDFPLGTKIIMNVSAQVVLPTPPSEPVPSGTPETDRFEKDFGQMPGLMRSLETSRNAALKRAEEAEREVAEFRALIENAPHSRKCVIWTERKAIWENMNYNPKCNCWKAVAKK